ncbi:MAG: ABC transporter substrate-binding protein [Pseudonocardiales bacterium]|nr:ABC transporter substrate-binding protein [Pseudonocardiales bacterium]
MRTPMTVEDATRREFLALLAGAGLLTACSAEAGPAPTAATRTHDGAYGRAELPLSPQRVVTMYATDTDVALVLGLPLAGAYAGAPGTFAPYHAERLGGVTPVTTYPDPDYEAIAALAPDLVLHVDGYYTPEHGPTLTGIAPVLALPEELAGAAEWRPRLAEVAALLGREDAAAAFVAAYEERAAALRERVQARWGGASIAYVGPIEPGVFYVAQANMQTHQTLSEDLGMPLASVVPATVETRRTDISYEEIGLLADVDVILLRVNPRPDTVEPDLGATRAITTSPLWAGLPAAQAGAVFEIPADLFYSSPLTAEANLDWAERNLLA